MKLTERKNLAKRLTDARDADVSMTFVTASAPRKMSAAEAENVRNCLPKPGTYVLIAIRVSV